MVIIYDRNNALTVCELIETLIYHSNCSNLRKTEFEPADDTVLTKIETSGLSTELIWDEFANFGFFKESNDESQVPQIHKPFQSPTSLPDINGINYDIINDNTKEMNLPKMYRLYGRLYYLRCIGCASIKN